MDVGWGMIPGFTRFTALGLNPDIDTGTVPQDIWNGGGLYPWMTAATTLQLVSTSASDIADGVGARNVIVSGLDANYASIQETVTLNGLTPVTLVNQFLRVNSMIVMSAGNAEGNVGTLNLTRVSGGNLQCRIDPMDGISRQAVYTVPAGNTLQITDMFFSSNKAATIPVITVAVWTRTATGVARMPLEIGVYGTPYRHSGIPGIIVPEKMDFSLRCTYTSVNNAVVTGAFLGVLRTGT